MKRIGARSETNLGHKRHADMRGIMTAGAHEQLIAVSNRRIEAGIYYPVWSSILLSTRFYFLKGEAPFVNTDQEIN